MCGFAGFLGTRDFALPDLLSIAERMADSLDFRGPDGRGLWADPESGFAVGFRRLAIIDLSANGEQPMTSADGRYVMVFNGEIYNAPDIGRELRAKGVSFRGHSDTEVLLEAIGLWGLEKTLEQAIGMFAIALWDKQERRLALARDRLGIKPLYYGRVGGVFFFGSQPRSFFQHPRWRPEIDQNALRAFVRFGYVPAPLCMYQGIRKALPGEIIALPYLQEPERSRFWTAESVAADGLGAIDTPGFDEDRASDRLEELLRDSVRRRLLADVPVGAFLSGGIDSSTVVALMQRECHEKVRTYSIGFQEPGFNEADHARSVAQALGTDHRELIFDSAAATELVPSLPDWFDEPFADSSQLPTLLVSRMASEEVTVALSGDGGDELFSGYPRYRHADRLRSLTRAVPMPMRKLLSAALRAPGEPLWDAAARTLPTGLRTGMLENRASQLADILTADSAEQVYLLLVSHWRERQSPLPMTQAALDKIWHGALAGSVGNSVARMQLIDTLTYLPDDILAKVDRSSMAFGLEARVPLLDHRVVEFVWRLRRTLGESSFNGKRLLRRILYRYVPRHLVDRPKMGFGIPLGSWLRGDLRDWAESLLSEDELARHGFFDAKTIARQWSRHLTEAADASSPLWIILAFQSWHQRWMQSA